jgi:uncharacterized repeat protein (TIGR02543 family)
MKNNGMKLAFFEKPVRTGFLWRGWFGGLFAVAIPRDRTTGATHRATARAKLTAVVKLAAVAVPWHSFGTD